MLACHQSGDDKVPSVPTAVGHSSVKERWAKLRAANRAAIALARGGTQEGGGKSSTQWLSQVPTAFLSTDLTDREVKQHKLQVLHRWVMHPYARIVLLWDALLLACIIFVLFEVPYLIGFGVDLQWHPGLSRLATAAYVADYVADVVFILDIGFSFRIAYVEDGVLQDEPSKIRKRYLTTFFVP